MLCINHENDRHIGVYPVPLFPHSLFLKNILLSQAYEHPDLQLQPTRDSFQENTSKAALQIVVSWNLD
jgi:hypothetical protein